MEKLAKIQSEAGKSIERMVENFYKDSKTRKNIRYYRNRITRLENDWKAFKARDTELQQYRASNPEHPYFEEQFFNQVNEAYEELKGELEDGLRDLEVTTADLASASTLNAGANTITVSAEDLQKRIRVQEALIASMTRAIEVIERELDESVNRSRAYCQQHLHNLGNYWTAISTAHHNLVAEDNASAYKATLFQALEDRYQRNVVKLMELSEPLESPHQPIDQAQTALKLPKVTIPTFTGDYMRWKQFSDLFSQLIDKQSLPNAQKMFYLKANLAGEASRLIQHLQISEENYETAWQLLKNRYDNERLIISAYLTNMLAIPAVNTDSAIHLKRLHDTVKESLLGIQNLGIDTANWDPLILHLLLQKIDRETHRLFEQSLTEPRKVQKLTTFLDFIETRFQLLETLGEKREKRLPRSKDGKNQSVLLTAKEKPICELCKNQHYSLRQCAAFLKLSPTERLNSAKRLNCCLNCLQKGHSLKQCQSRNCLKCNRRHNTLLHIELPRSVNPQDPPQINSPKSNLKPNSTVHAAFNRHTESSYVFLSTAAITVKSHSGQPITCRAILDSGSQLNFITERLFNKLGFQGTQQPVEINGIGGSKLHTQGCINITIQSRINVFSTTVEVVILPEITSFQPSQTFNTSSWPIPDNIKLADPEFNKPRRVDLLLGADIYSDLISIGQIKLSPNLPTLQNSVLGWIVIGRAKCESSPSEQFCGISTNILDTHLQRFWALEECQSTTKPVTESDRKCEEIFKNTTYRNHDGRFVVKLPFSQPPDVLGESKETATRRFLSLERRLEKNKELKQQYKAFIHELLEMKHMEPVEFNDIPKAHYFLPHHCVIKPESTTTKLRVVFDGSCKASNNISLNNILLTGPTIQDELFSILLRFRLHKYVFTADIAKMYRQILVAEEDRYFQLILWRDRPTDPLKCYRLRTVTYGTASAPYLATKALYSLAEELKKNYPVGARVAQRDFYVDDIITGSNNLQEALTMQRELKGMLKEGGFPLRKWSANHVKLLQNVPKEDLETMINFNKEEEGYIKSLGLIWYPYSDQFSIRVNLPDIKRVTKRTILADIAHIYDPLGLINPVVSMAKIFLQQLWQMKLDWDAAISQELHTRWLTFREGLKTLASHTIPRHVFSEHSTEEIQLHAFSDASEKAYGAAVYIRSTDHKGKIIVNLLCAKSRVAPIKKTTIPRLELCAAHLMVKLVKKVKGSLHINIENTTYWTDSSVTLSWIRTPSASLKTFVANRVAYIQEHTKQTEWKHVPTKSNPADLLSRGARPADLISSTLWFRGPIFLQKDSYYWPTKTTTFVEIEEEKRSMNSALITVTDSLNILDAINHRNSFKTLQHTIAYLKRFASNLRRPRHERILDKWLRITELQDALNFIMKHIQTKAFPDEIRQLKQKKVVSPSSQLTSLTPFLDENGIIRVGGRLQAANLPYDAKHPIILPHSDKVVKLLLVYLHEKHLHAGPQALLAITRQQFWPLHGKTLAQSILRNCVRCSRAQPKLLTQLMGNLPQERVQPARPFANVGVDFCGPMHIHYHIRGKKPTKAYIAVFVCFATKAVHLELVSDLTKDAFLGALKRFIGRRGRPAKIFCDNATNFVGAKNELSEVHSLFSNTDFQTTITQLCSQEYIEWCFIPPRSPHFGGLWEAAVKAAKYHLKRVLNGASLTYEELHTVIVEVEAVLNSRPLTPLSSDPNDLQALSPGHFLIGEPLTAIINPCSKEQNCKLIHRWELVKSLQQEFWRRWKKEYLQQLQGRPKWQQSKDSLKTGTLVLIKDENTPVLKWPLGRIIEQHKGPDGLTRVVDVKTEKGILRRTVHNLCPLPMEDGNNMNNDSEETSGELKSLNDEKRNKDHENKTAIKSHNTSLLVTTKNVRPKKIKIHPINQAWLTSPALHKVSNQLLKYSNHAATTSTQQQSPLKRTTQAHSDSASTSKMARLMFTILLVLCTPSHGLSINEVMEISPFSGHPAIYFEDIAQMSMITDNWEIIVYYNLEGYWKEVHGLQLQLRKLKEVCTQDAAINSRQYCQLICIQFQHQLDVILMNNEILMKRNGGVSRMKRSPFDVVGTVANRLFGVLDQEYAQQVSNSINKIKENEEHLLELIKNQTSVIDSTENIIKRDQEINEKQFLAISNYLEELRKGVQNNNQIMNDFQIIQAMNTLSTYTTLVMLNYQRTQQALIEVVTDCHNGKINTLVLTPNQLREELRLIRENIPSSLNIPGQMDQVDLPQLYNLMTVQTRVTKENIIFKINLPLLRNEVFQIFKIIPIPIRFSGQMVRVKPSAEFIAVNLHRDYYYLMTQDELAHCTSTSTQRYICNKKHAIFQRDSGKGQCEVQLLNQENTLPTICKLEEVNVTDTWTQLYNPNNWIYNLDKRSPLNIVCGTDSFQHTLQGNGLLKFKSNCIIKQNTLTIFAHHQYSNKIDNSFIPSITLNMSSLHTHLIQQEEFKKPHSLIIRNNSEDITRLKNVLHSLQGQMKLPQKITPDMHHYTISYLALSVALISTAAYLIKRQCCNQRSNIRIVADQGDPPEPAPRRTNFQLHTKQPQTS